MSIGEQFKGLDMKNLIGGPLTAAAESSVLLARSTAEFINQVGFDANKKARTVAFKFSKQEPTPDGHLESQEMSVDIPLLAIVPIPNLQIDEVNILFDMEVKQCEKSESSMSGSGSFSAKVGWGPISVSVSGSVSAHSSNTRSTDNSAKYHVDVRATNHGIPEGLARVLDMMAANVAPNLIGSRPIDASGAELTGERRERNLKLKVLREQLMQLESAENAARDTLDIRMGSLTRSIQNAQNAIRVKLTNEKEDAISKIPEGDGKEKSKAETEKKYSDRIDKIDGYWNTLQISAKDKVALASSSDKNLQTVYPALKEEQEATTSTEVAAEVQAAADARKKWEDSNKAVQAKKMEYNNVMMGIPASSETK